MSDNQQGVNVAQGRVAGTQDPKLEISKPGFQVGRFFSPEAGSWGKVLISPNKRRKQRAAVFCPFL
jgi:hypothetical protein